MTASSRLRAEHVRRAIAEIDRHGLPPSRGSTKYELVVDGKRYPPKYTLGLAMRYATGHTLGPGDHYGGEQSNGPLRELGFVVVEKGAPVGQAFARPSTLRLPPPEAVAPRAPKPPRPLTAPRLPVTPSLPTPTRSAVSAVRTSSSAPSVVRVVVQGRPTGDTARASSILLHAFERSWPTAGKALFTITPGGFVVGDFPARWRGGAGWTSRDADLAALVEAAKPTLSALLSPKVLAAARPRTHFLTVGLDLLGPRGMNSLHAELVAVVDVATGKTVRWTGKSYPVDLQEETLVGVTDLASHLLEVAGERVVVLGCHDLNLFSNRAYGNQREGSRRRQRCDEMRRVVDEFGPTMVLQHPHTTDTPNIWGAPWGSLKKRYPAVKAYASGIGFYNPDGPVRGSLDSVLKATRSSDGVFDIVVPMR